MCDAGDSPIGDAGRSPIGDTGHSSIGHRCSPIGSNAVYFFPDYRSVTVRADAAVVFIGDYFWLHRYQKAEVMRTKHSALAAADCLLTVDVQRFGGQHPCCLCYSLLARLLIIYNMLKLAKAWITCLQMSPCPLMDRSSGACSEHGPVVTAICII